MLIFAQLVAVYICAVYVYVCLCYILGFFFIHLFIYLFVFTPSNEHGFGANFRDVWEYEKIENRPAFVHTFARLYFPIRKDYCV